MLSQVWTLISLKVLGRRDHYQEERLILSKTTQEEVILKSLSSLLLLQTVRDNTLTSFHNAVEYSFRRGFDLFRQFLMPSLEFFLLCFSAGADACMRPPKHPREHSPGPRESLSAPLANAPCFDFHVKTPTLCSWN